MINHIDKLGILYKLKRRRLLEKVKTLNQDYGKNWFFVVTDKKWAPKYNKLGETHDKRYIASTILRIFREAK